MPETTLLRLPLGDRPRIVNCGFGEHGLHGSEEYELPKLWCLHLYFYFLHPLYGLLHLRLQTWFPFTVTVFPESKEAAPWWANSGAENATTPTKPPTMLSLLAMKFLSLQTDLTATNPITTGFPPSTTPCELRFGA